MKRFLPEVDVKGEVLPVLVIGVSGALLSLLIPGG
jgi:hypothetical protein